jgi:hypothetical protein
MSNHEWRNTVTATVYSRNMRCRGKLAFKTRITSWIGTADPVIVVVSVQSRIHDDIAGDLKMHALMKTIKSQVKGKITVFLAERAHIQADRLKHHCSFETAAQQALDSARLLLRRYSEQFEGCNVAFWESYICTDRRFASSLALAKKLYIEDPLFKERVQDDAEASYTPKRAQECPNKIAYIEHTIIDLIEQCACVLVFAHKGYRFQFYPGSPYACTEYISRLALRDNRTLWIDVSLRIEKKTFMQIAA